jgi:hypothetical protein
MRAFLSIDWDFFVRSLYAWDWGHQESPFFMSGAMWEIRMSGLLVSGLDIRDEMDPGKWANPKPWAFWNILKQLGYDFSVIDAVGEDLGTENFVVADSHAVAGPTFRGVAEELGPPDVLINIDAHHDMGYGDKASVNRMVAGGQVSCDMWLRSLASMYSEMKVNVVYPNWRFEEFPISDERDALKKVLPPQVLKRTKIGAFVDDNGSVSKIVNPAKKIEVEALFICRSSAWTPPWLDSQFIEFVESIDEHTGSQPLEYVSEHTGNVRPLQIREDFSLERAQAMSAQMKDLMQQHQKPVR